MNRELSPDRCQKWVFSGERIDFAGHQCSHKVFKDGLCKLHQPDRVAKRAEETSKRREEKRETMPMYSKRDYEGLKAKLAVAERRIAELEKLIREVEFK